MTEFLNSLQELLRMCALEKVAASSSAERAEYAISIFIHGQHENLGLRHLRFQLADALHPVHAREIDIHENHVRF